MPFKHSGLGDNFYFIHFITQFSKHLGKLEENYSDLASDCYLDSAVTPLPVLICPVIWPPVRSAPLWPELRASPCHSCLFLLGPLGGLGLLSVQALPTAHLLGHRSSCAASTVYFFNPMSINVHGQLICIALFALGVDIFIWHCEESWAFKQQASFG